MLVEEDRKKTGEVGKTFRPCCKSDPVKERRKEDWWKNLNYLAFLRTVGVDHPAILKPNLPMRGICISRNRLASVTIPGLVLGCSSLGKHCCALAWISKAAPEALGQGHSCSLHQRGVLVFTVVQNFRKNHVSLLLKRKIGARERQR
jgi:hypothetical protein